MRFYRDSATKGPPQTRLISHVCHQSHSLSNKYYELMLITVSVENYKFF